MTFPGVYIIKNWDINSFAVDYLLVGVGLGFAPQPKAARGWSSQVFTATAVSKWPIQACISPRVDIKDVLIGKLLAGLGQEMSR